MPAATLIMALVFPAFHPGPTDRPQPLLWETPISWAAPAPEVRPVLSFTPAVAKKVEEAQNIRQISGPAQAAAGLAKATELELVLLRAGLKQAAGDLKGAMADYEIVLKSKNRTIPRALAVAGFKNALRKRIENGEKGLNGRLIQSLKEEWRNEEALALLPGLLADPEVPKEAKDYIRAQEPIMALRLGRFERAAELWANPTGRSETQWLAQTEQRRGNFARAAELRLGLAAGKSRLPELTAAWNFLVKGGLYDESEALVKKNPDLKKAADFSWRMGLAALSQKELEPAENYFRAIIQNPKDKKRQAGARYFLGRTLAAAGKTAEARGLWDEVAGGAFGYYHILAQGCLADDGEARRELGALMGRLMETGPSGRDNRSLGYLMWVTEKGLTRDQMEIAAADLSDDQSRLNPGWAEALAGHDWADLLERLRRNESPFKSGTPAAAQTGWPRLSASIAALGGDYRLAVSGFSRIPSEEPRGLKRWSHPLVYSCQVLTAQREYGLPPALLLSLIRTESAYQPDIMSASNARGLMQLLPATAAKVAARLGLPEPGALDLFNPDLNVRLGSWYLAALIEGFDNESLALAGYNGGPYNIRSLILAKEGMPLDVFVESLPFEETANYVKRITESRYIYETVYLGDAHLPDLSAPVRPPRPSLPDF